MIEATKRWSFLHSEEEKKVSIQKVFIVLFQNIMTDIPFSMRKHKGNQS